MPKVEKLCSRANAARQYTGIRLSQEGKTWKDQNGKSYKADLVIQAVGIDINTEWISGAMSILMSEKGAVKVGPDLRVEGSNNIFALGDINDVPETKLAKIAVTVVPIFAPNA